MTKRATGRNGGKPPKKAKAAPVKTRIVIDGIAYEEAGEGRTFGQDIHMMHLLEVIGLNDIDPKSFASTFSAQRETFKIISKAYKEGILFEMMGTAMVEVGKEAKWTPETAEEVGEIFKNTTNKEARTLLEQNMVRLLFDFFTSALASQNNFQNFSTEAVVVEKKSATGEPSTTASGNPLSERSRRAIQIAQDRLSDGP